MSRNYLMVRAMSSQEVHFKEFFDNSVVAIGWSDINIANYDSADKVKEAVKLTYYSERSGAHISKKINQCTRFYNICEGDYIIVPYYSGIALAVAEKEAFYSEKGKELDLANQHRVKYLYKDNEILSVPRSNLSDGLQRRLRVLGSTVTDLSEFSKEIEALFNTPESYSYSNIVKEEIITKQKEFKQKLLDNIRGGKTNLPSGGVGLEELVCALFESQGYKSKVLSKSTFNGMADADVEAIRDDDFWTTKIYAQVKHHDGTSGRYGIDQIIKAIQEMADNGDYNKGFFITSADVDDKDITYAEDNNITVIDGERLVEVITSNLNRLRQDIINKLGIIMVPSIFNY